MGYKKRFSGFLLIVAVGFLSACGGDGDSDGGEDIEADQTVARIEITPASVLMAGIDETVQLTAVAYNARGEELDTDVSWSSSKPENISLEQLPGNSARLTSAVAAGSTQIEAEVDGVSSSIIALATTTVANAKIVSDEKILGKPVAVDPDAEWAVGYRYTVRLHDMTAEVGDILIASETVPFNGRVIEVEPSGNELLVTLETVTIAELFTDLKIHESIPLQFKPEYMTPEFAEYYTFEEQADGSLLFTPKPQNKTSQRIALAPGGAIGTSADLDNIYIGPFKCPKGDLNPTQNMITLPSLLPTFPFNPDIDFLIDYEENNNDFKIAIKGGLSAEIKFAPKINVQIDVKLSCKKEMFVIPMPNVPALQWLLGAKIPVGIGFDIGGKLTVAGIGVEAAAKVTADAELGIVCPMSAECGMINTLGLDGDASFEFDMPADDFSNSLRLEPVAGAFVYAEVALGNPIFFTLLHWDVLEFKAGLTNTANLATVNGQTADNDYKSDYKLTFDLSAGFANDAENAIEFLKGVGIISNSVNKVELKIEDLLFSSPVATELYADVHKFSSGDEVIFNIKLDPETLNYYLPGTLGLPVDYNVDDIIIYHKTDPDGEIETTEVNRITATEDQSEFTVDWIADFTGDIGEDFYAFVTTKAWPLPVLDELELGKVSCSDSTADEQLAQWPSAFIDHWDNSYIYEVEYTWGSGSGLEGGGTYEDNHVEYDRGLTFKCGPIGKNSHPGRLWGVHSPPSQSKVDIVATENRVSWSGSDTSGDDEDNPNSCDPGSTITNSQTGYYEVEGDTLTGYRKNSYVVRCPDGSIYQTGNYRAWATGTRTP